jgi:hypothetical protein
MRVAYLQRQVAQAQSKTKNELISKLVEKLIEDINSKNDQIAELTRQKNAILSNQSVKADEKYIQKS